MEVVIKPHVDWYTRQEQDQLLEGMFRLEPQCVGSRRKARESEQPGLTE